jgi:hypothetical protein
MTAALRSTGAPTPVSFVLGKHPKDVPSYLRSARDVSSWCAYLFGEIVRHHDDYIAVKKISSLGSYLANDAFGFLDTVCEELEDAQKGGEA